MKERLQKIIAQAGVCSRRAAEELLRAGRVTVNGRRAEIGAGADAEKDRICVDGRPLAGPSGKRYLMLNKPRGYVSTLSDERGRKTVADLVRDSNVRVVPGGRLDYPSEGLLLMTNDGDLVFGLTHPHHEVPKHYLVTVRGPMDAIPRLSEEMEIDGHTISPAKVSVLEQGEGEARLKITIHEGRNRQIRKMCEQVGLAVRRLKRIAVGKLELDSALAPGKWRDLTAVEVDYLKKLTEDELLPAK